MTIETAKIILAIIDIFIVPFLIGADFGAFGATFDLKKWQIVLISGGVSSCIVFIKFYCYRLIIGA